MSKDKDLDFQIGDNSSAQLRAFAERIERLEEEKQALADDIKEVYGEAKSTGFDATILRKALRLRKMDPAERKEQEQLIDLYMAALGEDAANSSEGGE